MHGDDDLGPASDLPGDVGRVHVHGAGVNVCNDDFGADGERIGDGCDEGDGRGDDLVAGAEIGVAVAYLETGGGIGDEAGVLRLEQLRRLVLELAYVAAE